MSFACHGLVAAGAAHAQAAQNVEKAEVTGSNIMRADQESPALLCVFQQHSLPGRCIYANVNYRFR